ncbi:uncharacterized protein LOC126996244 [Eriocheir sinensis]|uniref:uncharacterized protein LOC126996244 n=1 Tax=Eriocheir sinensis TaxID=95602 RepID=UPI0021C6916B|nr:uncharacterized protein LOC126996244 [Eriocheir sinensis]
MATPKDMAELMQWPRWTNLRVCQVEQPDIIWVREFPSTTCSEELQNFLRLERQLGEHYKDQHLQYSQHWSLLRVGSHVVVYHQRYWARGQVESVPGTRSGKARVFLHDYGCTVEEQVQNIVVLEPGEWTSVPYQAKRICLAGVAPASLQCLLLHEEPKMVLKECQHWDPAAASFVGSVCEKSAKVEFEPVGLNHEGCVSGRLAVSLPRECWAGLVPRLEASVHPETSKDWLTLDLALVLVAEGYAVLQTQSAQMEQGSDAGCRLPGSRLTKSSTGQQDSSLSSAEESLPESYPSRHSSRPPSSLFIGSTESIPGNTSMSKCKDVKPSHADQNGDHASPRSQQGGALFTSWCDFENTSASEGNAQEKVSYAASEGNAQEKVSYAASEGNAQEKVSYSASEGNAQEKVSYSASEGNAQEKVSYSCKPSCKVKLKGENCSYHDSLENKDIISNLSGEESFISHVDCTEKNSVLSSKGYSGSNNIPKEVQLKPLDYMNDFVKYAEIKAVVDAGLCDEFNVSGPEATKNLLKKLDREEDDIPEKSHTWEVTVNSETICEPFFSSFLLIDEGFEVEQCSSSPDEGLYNSLVKQDAPPEAPDITKLYRVFIAGEHSVSEEEVIKNKNLVSTALNDQIVSAVLKRGMRATRLQAYAWPLIAKGRSAVVVGEKSCGKTMGYVVPLLSTILDTWKLMSERLSPGIGPVMVVVCSGWQSAKCVAENVVTLLPASTPFKIMTAWGGCGHEEEVSTGKQLCSGCDILITTAPCLLRLLTGGPQGAATTLKRCCHLVFDDIDVTLQQFPSEVKEILIALGKGRRKSGRRDLELQVVLVSTRWTELLCQLTQTLLPLLEPTLVISAPCEAALATKVPSNLHLVSSETEALLVVVRLTESCVFKKKMVFVSNDDLAESLSEWMKGAGVRCVTVSSTTHMWKVQQFVQEWHVLEAMTMIVCQGAEVSLLSHDIANAQVLFHTHLGPSLTTLTQRYSFMTANFVTDLNQSPSNCESHLILTKCALEKLPGAMDELYRICEDVPCEVKKSVEIIQNGRNSKYKALCYYLKAYGRCYKKHSCKFRHVVKISDVPQHIPRFGEVTFKVIRSLSASRYIVHLTQYRDKAGAPCTDLANTYPALCSALHSHYQDAGRCESLECAQPGVLCAVQDKDAWVRAQIISVNHRASSSMINVFLIDEGKQVTVSLESAKALPLCLAAVPQLAVEVLLCCVQPMDGDHSWTLQATHFAQTNFAQKKNNKFIGRISLALGCTLWLNPAAEFIKIDKMFVQKQSLRGKLLSENFGMDNPTHMKNLEELCAQAGVSLEAEAVPDSGWRTAITEALDKLKDGGGKEDNPRISVTDPCAGCGESSREEKETRKMEHLTRNNLNSIGSSGSEVLSPQHQEERESNLNSIESSWSNVLSPQHQEERESNLNSIGSSGSKVLSPQHQKERESNLKSGRRYRSVPALCQEKLALDQEVMVKVVEVVSPEEFFVIKADKLKELNALEVKMRYLAELLGSCDHRGDTGRARCCLGPTPSSASPCLVTLNDNRCCRGVVRGGGAGGSVSVFLVDHGRTVQVDGSQVHGCPEAVAEPIPGQAISCTLPHTAVPDNLKEAATQAMLGLTDMTDSWTVKVLAVDEGTCGPVYAVELTNDSFAPPLDMRKELAFMGFPLFD